MDALDKAKLSLRGLATGDAFGERLAGLAMESFVKTRKLPEGIWRWTDDTAMAISVVENLRDFGSINQDELAQSFAKRYRTDRYRGYGAGVHLLLTQLSEGADWRAAAPALFDGGSYGNGASMRIAPLGGYYSGNPEKAAQEAAKSAVITHAHQEAQAGAMAIAVAAALAATQQKMGRNPFIEAVLDFVPESEVASKMYLSRVIEKDKTALAVQALGNGSRISAQDTVPFCVWCAANNLVDYEAALWQTVSGGGDQDTTCAMVGGIVALSCGSIPQNLAKQTEELPEI